VQGLGPGRGSAGCAHSEGDSWATLIALCTSPFVFLHSSSLFVLFFVLCIEFTSFSLLAIAARA
jgi:hypothetical protein